uniref:PDZ domain-containing protein n=1 Tax=Bursaphelenchus xylophilus TaxID=6326 RepID=A0A1I7RIW2_BURXY
MSGTLHAKVDFFASGTFGTVTSLRTYEDSVCNRRAETITLTLRLIGAPTYGLSLRQACSSTSTSNANCQCSAILVDSIQPNSPASHVGLILPGDRILSMNDQPTFGMSVDQAYSILDDSHCQVKLTIEFDVYETCPLVQGTITVRLIKHTNHLGLEFTTGLNKKEEKIVVKSVQKGSLSYRCGAIEPGDEFLSVDDVPLDNCTVQETIRLLQTARDSVKIHISKRNAVKEKSPTPKASNLHCFTYTIELRPGKRSLGLFFDDKLKVAGIKKDGYCAKSGAVLLEDRLMAIDGQNVSQYTLLDVQKALDRQYDSIRLTFQREREGTPSAAEDLPQRGDRAVTPSTGRLNLIDIKKIISDMTFSSRAKELQALKAFEETEDKLISGRLPQLKRDANHDQLRTIQQRLSGSFSSSGFGSVVSSQPSAPETPSYPSPFSGLPIAPTSIFSNTKNVLLLRDLDQPGFGFSITENEQHEIIVNAVKPGGVAEANDVRAMDKIIEVNNVQTAGMTCAELLPLFNTDILELILLPAEQVL